MNTNEANHLNFPDLLSRLGHEPVQVKKGGREYWYKSPFRDETEPSFHTSQGHTLPWVWFDFAVKGGTVMDFLIKYWNTDPRGALSKLRPLYNRDLFQKPVHERSEGDPKPINDLFSSRASNDNSTHDLVFLKAYPIKNPIIYKYLAGRGIPKRLVDLYLEEVKYFSKKKGRGKEYFAFGMRNRSGGYEIRAATDEYTFKSSLIKKDISVIVGTGQGRNAINIFEGMVDYLSLLVFLSTDKLKGDTVVLHSLNSYNRCMRFLEEKSYGVINTFLDNNDAGQQHTQRFIDDYGSAVHPQSHTFSQHTDLNDALKAGMTLSL